MRLRKDAKSELLKRAPLFANCSKRELAAIGAIADEIKNQRKVNTLEPMDFFGEIALIHETPRTATVKATSPVRALVITERNFRRLLKDQPEIQRKVLEALAERLAPTTL